MKLIFVSSPYRGDIQINKRKAQEYCRFVWVEGHIPFAPHLHNTTFLSDKEDEAGIQLGLNMLLKCNEMWVFGDVITEGMQRELNAAQKHKITVRFFTVECEEGN